MKILGQLLNERQVGETMPRAYTSNFYIPVFAATNVDVCFFQKDKCKNTLAGVGHKMG